MLTAAALIFPIILLLFFKKWTKAENVSAKKLPPAPKPLPIIGNLNLITTPAFRCFRDLSHRYGPIIYLKFCSAPAVVVSSPEIAEKIMKTHDTKFANKPRGVAAEIMWYNYMDIAFCPYGDYWRQIRKICINQLLSPSMVRSFGSIRKDEACKMVESLRLSCGTEVNLTEKIFSFSSSITCRAAFGKVCRDKDTLIKLGTEILKSTAAFEIADLFPSSRVVYALSWTRMRAKKMRRKLDLILDGIIDEHSRNLRKNIKDGDSGRWGNGEFGTEDFVDVLLRIKEEENLGNDNVKALMFDMFGAGTETSSTVIDWTMVELMRNPRVMKKTQAEIREVLFKENENAVAFKEEDVHKLKYLKLVIKETMRLHPPAAMLQRAPREECEINGYSIPVNVKVFIYIWAMQRDPQYWKDPERFEPERFENQTLNFTGGDFEFLPFGSGKRMCPGMEFGLTTVEVGLAYLLYNFDWKLPEGVMAQDLNMIENSAITSARKDNLFIIASPYKPSGRLKN